MKLLRFHRRFLAGAMDAVTARNAWGLLMLVLALGVAPLRAEAIALSPFPLSDDYLIVGAGPKNNLMPSPASVSIVGIGKAGATSNYELGANKAPVPSTSGFLCSASDPSPTCTAPGTGGPDLAGAGIQNNPLPSNIAPVPQGITFDGNVAITNPDGTFDFSNIGVFADPGIGIRCQLSAADCNDGTSNSFFNDPEQFPNTFTPDIDPTGGTGFMVEANDCGPGCRSAIQSTRIDEAGTPGNAGVTGGFDHTALRDELFGIGGAAFTIPALASTGTLSPLDFGAGCPLCTASAIVGADVTVALAAGLNVIDIDVAIGTDFLINNANLVIDGPADAFAIFRLPLDPSDPENGNSANMLIQQANVLAGDGGIGLNNILFFSSRPTSGDHFAFDDTIINGVAFWTVAAQGGGININNAQGCTQLIGDKIDLQNIRFSRCAFVVPEPSTVLLFASGLMALALGGANRMGRRSLTVSKST